MNNKQYLYYVPEFDTIILTNEPYEKFWRDAFVEGLKGMTKLVFLDYDNFGF